VSFDISVSASFSAAHAIKGMVGSCEKLHGHNWRVDVRLEGDRLDNQGMVLDFKEGKRILAEALEPFDHAYLNEVPPFDGLNPSSENLARVIAEAVAKRLPEGVRVAGVTTWESDCCAASYTPD